MRPERIALHELRGGAPHPCAHVGCPHHAKLLRHHRLHRCAGHHRNAFAYRPGALPEGQPGGGQESAPYPVPADCSGGQRVPELRGLAVLAAVHHGHAQVDSLQGHERHWRGPPHLHLDAARDTHGLPDVCLLLPSNDGAAQAGRQLWCPRREWSDHLARYVEPHERVYDAGWRLPTGGWRDDTCLDRPRRRCWLPPGSLRCFLFRRA
mmetsp:Transcript_52845/g.113221  ORF Transcript_52845/g.113221 Transcript_52845/m.113221 type:complete len:208 (-) Transcript_52845:535-1158(-)